MQAAVLTACVQGFFVPYTVGGINIAVLAIGSTAPGLLQFAIDKFSLIWPGVLKDCCSRKLTRALPLTVAGAWQTTGSACCATRLLTCSQGTSWRKWSSRLKAEL